LRLLDAWRGLKAGPSLVRCAGYGFAAVALIHGTVLAERMAGTSSADRGIVIDMADLSAVEPAAGPEPSQVPSGPAAGDFPDADPGGCDPRLLQATQERTRQLEAWSSELADRAKMLEVIEARAAEQVHALDVQRRALETALAGVEQKTQADIARLVKIYENMDPKEAAQIFEAMPANLAAGFVRRMSESKSALVMGRINPQHAFAITLAMANSPDSAR
jgi:hypothetical protein